MRVLIVEDQYAGARLLSRLLVRLGSIDVAASKDEALKLAAGCSYDLFVVDINLGGGGTGIDLIHALRQDPRHAEVPAIACSAYVHPENGSTLLEEGFDGFVPKPFSIDELLSEVDRQIQSKGGRKSSGAAEA